MSTHLQKPAWLKINLSTLSGYAATKQTVESRGLHTICRSGRCPNQADCWNRGVATLMIAGDICTRKCKFCNTLTGRPHPLDADEPIRVAESVKEMQLKHAVVTSVDRDDLPDGGAAHWAETINAVRRLNPGVKIEVLIPDFQGRPELLDCIAEAAPDIVGHNMETVERLTPSVRSAACYDRSLQVLQHFAQRGLMTKSGIMVGLGETDQELFAVMDDLRHVGCSILTVGQYLQPTHRHHPVMRYVHPDAFERYKQVAIDKGFRHVESGPLVRSSYHAENFAF